MERVLSAEIPTHIGKEVSCAGWVHKVRKFGGLSFVVLRDRAGLVQTVVSGKDEQSKLEGLSLESVVRIVGTVREEPRAPGGAEVAVEKMEIVSPVKTDIPLEINKKEISASLETILEYRSVALRAPKIKAIFSLQAAIIDAFRNFFTHEGFVEISTPKIVKAGAEGGAALYPLEYHGKRAYLTQSPQFYKQIMVGVFERVFEVGHAYRAEEHNTSRHLNEYVSLDVEMGFIEGQEDLMQIETSFLRTLLDSLARDHAGILSTWQQTLPQLPKDIPSLTLEEAQDVLEKTYKKICKGAPDLDPEHERLLCEWSAKEKNSDFLFVTHFPTTKRPFYAMEDPKDSQHTLSFDLLFRGIEITTGGQRIHSYDELTKKMKKFGLKPDDFEFYLSAFRFGMPPHGGFAIGLERLTMKLLGLSNVREASLFPRDLNRLVP